MTARFAPFAGCMFRVIEAGSWIRHSTTTYKYLQGPVPASLLPPVQLGDSAISPILKCLRRSIRNPRLLSSPPYLPHFRPRPPAPDLPAPVQSQNSASARKPDGVPSPGSGTPRNVPDVRPVRPPVSVPVRRPSKPSPLRHRTHVVGIDS